MSNAESSVNKRIKSKEYPAYSLQETIDFIDKLKGYPLGKPISYTNAAKEIKVSTNTKSFKYLLSSARQFGLIETSPGQKLTITECGQSFQYPTDTLVAKELKLKCFKHPVLYKALFDLYEEKSIPPQNILENVLIQECGIAPNATEIAARVFLETAEQVGAIISGILTTSNIPSHSKEEKTGSRVLAHASAVTTNIKPYRDEEHDSTKKILEELAPNNSLEIRITLEKQRKIIFSYPSDLTSKEAKKAVKMIQVELEDILPFNFDDNQ